MKNNIRRRIVATGLLCAFVFLVFRGFSQEETYKLPEFKTVRLENGMTLLLMERHQLPLVSFAWILRPAGAIADPGGQEGLASVTAQLLRKGTDSRSADQISEALDFVGASLSAGAGDDYASGSAECVSKHLDIVLELLADTLTHPVFPQTEVTKLLKQEIDGIAEEKAVPNQVIGRYFERFLFGSHPYARPAGGTETSLGKIKREDVLRFYRERFSPSEFTLAVVGDFKAEEMQAKVEKRFGGWKRVKVADIQLSSPQPVAGRRALLVEKPDATQTFFWAGNVGLSRTNPDWVPLQVVNTLFGGRFTSMINSELRIKSGLTYGARSVFSAHPVPGYFAITSFTRNDTTVQALELTLSVLERLHRDGITPEQLQSAKAYIKGQFGPTLETNDQLAGRLCELNFYGLGPEYINRYFDRVDAVTIEDAKRLIRDHYPLRDLTFVLVGQPAVIGPAATKLGVGAESKPITAPGF